MNLIDIGTTLSQLEENKWYHIDPGEDFDSDILAIKLDGDSIYAGFIGGSYDKTNIEFKFSQRGLNEIWHHGKGKDYCHPLDKNQTNFNRVIQLSYAALALITDPAPKVNAKYTRIRKT